MKQNKLKINNLTWPEVSKACGHERPLVYNLKTQNLQVLNFMDANVI